MLSNAEGVQRARELRQALSGPELLLWNALKHRPHGLKFRRQERLGPYFLDFYCAPARLAIEIDGSQHEDAAAAAKDRRRDDWVALQGIDTLRLTAQDVFRSVDGAVEHICEEAWVRIQARRHR